MAELPTTPVVRLLKFSGIARIDAEAKEIAAEVAEKILLKAFKKLAVVLEEAKKKTATADMLNALAPEFEDLDEEVILKAAPVLRIAKEAGIERFGGEAKKIIGEVATRILLNEFYFLADALAATGKQTVTKPMLEELI
jgi:histone H3/H4